jgi:lipoprotein-anchoring transpeptidase ErfK/SrfK
MINLHQGISLVLQPWHTRLSLKHGRAAALGLGTIALLALTVSGTLFYYSGRILPGLKVAGVQIGGLLPDQARERLAEATRSYEISFVVGEQTFRPSPEELGISLDVTATVAEVYRLGHSGSVLHWIGDWWQLRQPELELKYRFDEAKLDAYVAKVVETTSKPAVNARLRAVDGAIVTLPEVEGLATGVEDAEAKIKQSLRRLGPTELVVGQKRLIPQIKAPNLTAAKAEAERLIAPAVTLKHGDKSFIPTISQRAAWLSFTEDVEAKTNKVAIDPVAVGRYLSSVVSPKVAYAATPRIVHVVAETGAQELAQEGRDGLAVDQDRLSRELQAALGGGQPYNGEVPTRLVAFETITKKVYERWIDVDLSEQRMWLYEKGTVIDTFLISSGKYPYVTPTGNFSVLGKTPIQDMDGDLGGYYFVPNVPSILWFKAGGYAIHGTYWHNNFGRTMSHGCLNLTLEKAAFVYNWAQIGTPVIVRA